MSWELHILAVDDSPVDRAVIAEVLRKCNYRVTVAESGRRALELLHCLEEPKVSIIITDYSMSDMTGLELLMTVKGSSELRGIPVVVFCSEDAPMVVARCLEEGAEDFLHKPVRLAGVMRLCSHITR